MAKLVAFLLGVMMGTALLGVVLGLTFSSLFVAAMAVTLLIRRDWVPIVYNARSLTVRKVTTAVTAAGLALVVFVFATVLMLSAGVRHTLKATGTDTNAKVIRKASQNEIQSGLLPEHLRLLSSDPGVATGKDGQPLASAELVVLIFAEKEGGKDSTDGTNIAVRGVGPRALELHPPEKLDGRMFQPGRSEVVIGRALAGRMKGMTLGGQVRFARRDWTVVGVMDQRGTAYDSEVWGDVDQFEDAFQRRPAFSSVTLRMRDKAAVRALADRVGSDPQLNSLEVKTEADYWAAQSEQFANFVTFLGTFVAFIFAFGAILGAMITMYAQVSARVREIGTLRALGFRRRAVLVSFVIESVLLGLFAGGIGVAAASLMQLASFSTLNWQTFSEVSFRFTLTPAIVAASFAFAVVMGFAGGLLPALRAARMPIVRATRGG